MDEVLRIIQANGFYVFLVGVIASILIGLIKTPIKNKVLPEGLSEAEKNKRSGLFDTITFLSTYVFAIIGAMIYFLISHGYFDFTKIISLSLPVWLSQSTSYSIWKKLGLKRVLLLLLKLIVKDSNQDGKIQFNEVISQIKSAYKNGKLDVDQLMEGVNQSINENLDTVIEEVASEVESTAEQEAVVQAINGDTSKLVEIAKEKVEPVVAGIKPIESIIKLAEEVPEEVTTTVINTVLPKNNN